MFDIVKLPEGTSQFSIWTLCFGVIHKKDMGMENAWVEQWDTEEGRNNNVKIWTTQWWFKPRNMTEDGGPWWKSHRLKTSVEWRFKTFHSFMPHSSFPHLWESIFWMKEIALCQTVLGCFGNVIEQLHRSQSRIHIAGFLKWEKQHPFGNGWYHLFMVIWRMVIVLPTLLIQTITEPEMVCKADFWLY